MTLQDTLTLIAVVVALGLGVFGPYIAEWWREKIEKSNLIVLGDEALITNQENFDPDNHLVPGQVLNVVRLAITNDANFKAKSVEANIEEIEWDSEKRKDFIPMPLLWTHRQSIRDIYPHQTVYLDILYIRHNPELVGEQDILFAVATGQDIDNLSKFNPYGESKISIKLYQESGQITMIRANIFCKNLNVIKVTLN